MSTLIFKLEHKKMLYNLMYKDSINFLKRKKEKFSNILNQHYKANEKNNQ